MTKCPDCGGAVERHSYGWMCRPCCQGWTAEYDAAAPYDRGADRVLVGGKPVEVRIDEGE